MWNKTQLENLIFYHAARAGCPCYGVQGCLQSPAAPAHLQALLTVYNRFFEKENRAFLKQDFAQTRADLRTQRKKQRQESLERPLQRSFRLF